MAKKSARSKGYRKQTGKKPYLSKRDIIMLCILLAVVAVGAILLFSYDDGGLKTKGGQIVDAGENWLIVNGAASGGKRYYKVGEVGELEGFTREGEPVLTDANLQSFRYTPEDESGALRSISISASAATVERLSEYYHDLLGASLTTGEVTEASCAAGDYTYFTYTNAYHAAEEAEDAAATEEDAAEGAADAAEAVLEEAAGDAEPEDVRIYERERLRLEMSLKNARAKDADAPITAMMHYPPLTDELTGFSDILEAYGVTDCVYGHLHGAGLYGAVRGERRGVRYHQVSCDGLEFKLYLLYP